MPGTSFEIASSVDLFRSLEDAVNDHLNDPTSSRKAIAAFMFSYHLREWIWKEHQALVGNKLGCHDVSAFNATVNRQYPDFRLIRDICNGSKHFDSVAGPVTSSGLSGGDFCSSDFSSDFDIGELTVETNSTTVSATKLLTDVTAYYEKTLRTLNLL